MKTCVRCTLDGNLGGESTVFNVQYCNLFNSFPHIHNYTLLLRTWRDLEPRLNFREAKKCGFVLGDVRRQQHVLSLPPIGRAHTLLMGAELQRVVRA